MAFTAIDDNDTVGFFTMRRPNESFDELRFGFVIIDPDRRGQGYGKKNWGWYMRKIYLEQKRYHWEFSRTMSWHIIAIKRQAFRMYYWMRSKNIQFWEKNGAVWS